MSNELIIRYTMRITRDRKILWNKVKKLYEEEITSGIIYKTFQSWLWEKLLELLHYEDEKVPFGMILQELAAHNSESVKKGINLNQLLYKINLLKDSDEFKGELVEKTKEILKIIKDNETNLSKILKKLKV